MRLDLLREFTPDMKRLFRKHAPKEVLRIEEKLPVLPTISLSWADRRLESDGGFRIRELGDHINPHLLDT
jgi:hypothetical protein